MESAAIRIQEINPAKLASLLRKELDLSKVTKGQTIACVTDLGTRREFIQTGFAAADELGTDCYEMGVNSIPGWTRVGVPTIGQCKGTLEALMAADIIVIFHVPLFTKWPDRRSVDENGTGDAIAIRAVGRADCSMKRIRSCTDRQLRFPWARCSATHRISADRQAAAGPYAQVRSGPGRPMCCTS